MQRKTERTWAEQSDAANMTAKREPLYLKVSVSSFGENSRDKRELSAAEEAGWENLHVIGPKGLKERHRSGHSWTIEEIDPHPFGDRGIRRRLGRLFSFLHYIMRIRKQKADVISGHDLLGVWLAHLASIGRRKKTRLIYDAHEYELGRFIGKRRNRLTSAIIYRLEKYVLKRCALTILVNPSIHDQMKRDYQLEFPAVIAGNIPVLREPDPEKSRQIRAQWKETMRLNETEPIFIYHGLVGPGRGIEEAVQALSATNRGGLVILGYGMDSYIKTLKDLRRQISKPERILFHEAVSGVELCTYLAAADIGIVLIYPISKSYYYAQPNKLFESIHAGNPVLASDLPEISRVVNTYGIGMLCDIKNPEDIQQKWKQLAEDYAKEPFPKRLVEAKKTLNWDVEKRALVNALRTLRIEEEKKF